MRRKYGSMHSRGKMLRKGWISRGSQSGAPATKPARSTNLRIKIHMPQSCPNRITSKDNFEMPMPIWSFCVIRLPTSEISKIFKFIIHCACQEICTSKQNGSDVLRVPRNAAFRPPLDLCVAMKSEHHVLKDHGSAECAVLVASNGRPTPVSIQRYPSSPLPWGPLLWPRCSGKHMSS